MKNTTQTTGRANTSSTWGRLARAARTWDRDMFAYRVVRRILCAGCWDGGTPLVFSGLYAANVADLQGNTRGRRRYEIRTATEHDLPQLTSYFGSEERLSKFYSQVE